MMGKLFLLVAVLVSLTVASVSGGNNNIDRTCSIDTGCLQCISRRSGDVEKCQQLYLNITFTTEPSLTGNYDQNKNNRYCTGDCPIILATANYFCSGSLDLEDLIRFCPSYSVNPTGSFDVRHLLSDSSCLPSSSSRCLECIAKDNKEAVRCMQLYLLANHPKVSSTYASQYCESNCPLILNSFGSYCGFFTDSYSYCQQRNNGQYCGQLRARSQSTFSNAVSNCFTCNSSICENSISEYGCCLRQSLGDSCSNISTCNFQVDASPTAIQVDSNCTVANCSSCLTRENDDLQRCEQLYAYLVEQDLVGSQASSVVEDFCSGNCPILLQTSDYYCGRSARSLLWQWCPSYQRVPSASVDVRASYGNGLSCSVREDCEECIISHSPEAARCLKLYFLLTQHPNMTDFYATEYCKGNCPPTLSTSEWYCDNRYHVLNSIFSVCRRTKDNQFCLTLIKQSQSDFNSAEISCMSSGCTGSQCRDAVRRYGCCLGRTSVHCFHYWRCAVLTAHAQPLNLTQPLLLAFFSVLMYYISRI